MKHQKNTNQFPPEVIKTELQENYGMKFEVDYGDDFFNALFYGTLKTFVERVDSSGFCHTSYGEENGVKAYGVTHYSRDSAEAAIALANCGFPDLAEKIISFTLNHIPEGQYYIPHVYHQDGSIKANTIQVDTPGHVARALHRCMELSGVTDTLRLLFEKLDFIYRETWRNHYHEDLMLLDAGNYNEQGFQGSTEPLADMFTNSSFLNGAEKMQQAAKSLNLHDAAAVYAEMVEKLHAGIEDILYQPDSRIYSIAYDIKKRELHQNINWLSLYPHRWYQGKTAAWENAFEYLKTNSTIDWAGMKIITMESPDLQFRVLGKNYAYLLAYLAETGRFSSLTAHLDFARRTIRRPATVFPEWWYHHTPAKMTDYWRGYWKKFAGVWTSYQDNSAGDYTVDSGNCEQSAVFLNHQLENMFGISPSKKQTVNLAPGLPFGFKQFSVKNFPICYKDGKMQLLEFQLKRSKSEVSCNISSNVEMNVNCKLPVPAKVTPEVFNDGKLIENYSLSETNEVKSVSLSLTGRQHNINIKYN